MMIISDCRWLTETGQSRNKEPLRASEATRRGSADESISWSRGCDHGLLIEIVRCLHLPFRRIHTVEKGVDQLTAGGVLDDFGRITKSHNFRLHVGHCSHLLSFLDVRRLASKIDNV